jgi:ABC-type phosphate/phosphonate transport system substrate-binding protein
MKPNNKQFIACGMYAFTEELQQAWQVLFNEFCLLFDGGDQVDEKLVFDGAESVLRDPGLFFGHTCGYPLMKHLQDTVTPFCVPVFNVTGVSGNLYSSRVIVASDADIGNLSDCRNRIAAINSSDSNSGMNVFRHAIAKQKSSTPFFAAVINSGGHLHSLTAVAEGRADVAAIDCVSFQLIEDRWPELTARVRSIGDSVKTCGLPLVLPNSNLASTNTGEILAALNEALNHVDPWIKQRLRLSHFESAGLDDYQGILEVESFAIEAGYPRLK